MAFNFKLRCKSFRHCIDLYSVGLCCDTHILYYFYIRVCLQRRWYIEITLILYAIVAVVVDSIIYPFGLVSLSHYRIRNFAHSLFFVSDFRGIIFFFSPRANCRLCINFILFWKQRRIDWLWSTMQCGLIKKEIWNLYTYLSWSWIFLSRAVSCWYDWLYYQLWRFCRFVLV